MTQAGTADSGKTVFFYGTLRDERILQAVLGDTAHLRITQAVLEGWRPHLMAGENYPALAPAEGARTEGVLASGLTEADLEAIWFFEDDTEYRLVPVTVQTAAGPVAAETFMARDPAAVSNQPWDFATWQAEEADLYLRAVREFMALREVLPHDEAEGCWTPICQRLEARRRARAAPAPTTLRRTARPGDVEITEHRTVFADFFAFEKLRFLHAGAAGGAIGPVERGGLVVGDVVTVLPYDPARDVVLLVEQLRIGAILRDDPQPWLIEPVAGRIDPGETPEQAARRETVEEAGIALGELHRVASFYPSPGTSSEFVYAYVGLADLKGTGGLGGLDEEDEDIRTHIVPFARLMALIDSGEANTGPLVASALWLAAQRQALRAAHGAD